MNYMTLKEASQSWGISVRRINLLCSDGRIPGAIKRQNLWMIPVSAKKPADGRQKRAPLGEPGVLLRNATYTETHTDFCDYDRIICEGARLLLEGHPDEGFSKLENCAKSCKDKQYLLVIYYMLYYSSNILAYESIQRSSKIQMDRLLRDPEVGELTKVLVQLGNLSSSKPSPIFIGLDRTILAELTPYLSLQALRSILTAYLTSPQPERPLYPDIVCRSLEDMDCPEAYVYCNILLSSYFSITGSAAYSRFYLEKAAAVALPRGWYLPFAQYAISLDLMPIDAINHPAFLKIRALSSRILNARLRIEAPANITFSSPKDVLDLRVAYQISCGRTNSAIAEQLGLSLYQVKQSVSRIYSRTGCSTRAEIKNYTLSHIMM